MSVHSFLGLWSLLSLAVVAASKEAAWNHLGNLSPYHKAPVPSGLSESLPEDCSVQQVMLMGRHGSRYPLVTELPYITNLTYKLGNASDAIQKAKLPANLEFLKSGYKSTLGVNDLTPPGRQQLFNHGVNFRLKYPNLQDSQVLAGNQDRVVESAQWFAQGYFGRNWPSLNATQFSTINEDNVTISWVTSMDTCPLWNYAYGNNATIEWGSVYIPPITKRLNAAVPGVNFTDNDSHGALYACAYDLAANGVSPWCDAFTDQEIADFEYELDLLMDGAFGYNLPDPMGPLLGTLYVDKLIERFTNATGNASAVYLEFGHDTTIDLAIAGLGLAKDKPALPAKGPVPADRKWKTSEQVPFGAQMVWEKFTCTQSAKGEQIRLVLNDAPFPLSTCTSSSFDKKHGSCALDGFVKANAYSTSIQWGDKAWNATCGPAKF